MLLVYFSVFLIISIKSIIIPTDCNVQLYNYYIALGLNGGVVPMQTALTLNSGVFMGNPYVEVTANFQGVARYYQSFINASLVSQTWSVDTSFDIPWCAVPINIMCYDNVSVATAKTSACTSLIDFDLGGTSHVAGRMLTYHTQTVPCNGATVVRFSNVSLVAFFDADYTYDAVGIRDHVQLDYTDARQFYRNSTCLHSDGDPADIITQDIFRCTAQRIGCAVPRTNGKPSVPVVPIPKFSCIGNLTSNGTVKVLWQVCSAQELSGADTSIGIAFTDNIGTGNFLDNLFSLNGLFYVLAAGTCRQFAADYNHLDHYLLLSYNGYVTSFSPIYFLSMDPIIRAIPCVCGFSMDCINGEADLTSIISSYLRLSNALPVPDPGPNIQFPITTPSFTLNATASYDPDGLPVVLSAYWKIYTTPYDPVLPPFVINNPSNFINIINSSTLIVGTYNFILYVSDGQEVTFTFFQVIVQPNQLQALTEPRKIVQFDFYTGTDAGHNCNFDFPPSPFITLDGTPSHGTDPSIPINYSWIQVGGPVLLYKCDPSGSEATRAFLNTTEAIATFVPYTIASYYFRLTVCDNVSCDTSIDLRVAVVPDFQNPPSTFTPIINFTNPPIRDLTPPTRPNYTYPNFTFPPLGPQTPVAGPPPSNITTPPLFPTFPSPTLAEYIGILFVGGSMIILFFAICVAWLIYSKRKNYAYLDTVGYGPGMRRFW